MHPLYNISSPHSYIHKIAVVFFTPAHISFRIVVIRCTWSIINIISQSTYYCPIFRRPYTAYHIRIDYSFIRLTSYGSLAVKSKYEVFVVLNRE
jgi:hypothetical protein